MPDGRLRRAWGWTLDGSQTSAAPVSPDGTVRLRSNADGTAIEVSYDGAAYTTLSGSGGSWSALTAPTADLTLAHGNYKTIFNFDGADAEDCFVMQSANNAAGSGVVLHVATQGASTSKAPLRVDAKGNVALVVDVNGRVGIGVDASHATFEVQGSTYFNYSATPTADTITGSFGITLSTPTSGSFLNKVYGLNISSQMDSNSTQGSVYGGYFSAITSGTGARPSLIGLYSAVSGDAVASGNVSEATGFYASMQGGHTGNWTNAYMFRGSAAWNQASAGTLAAMYGLYLEMTQTTGAVTLYEGIHLVAPTGTIGTKRGIVVESGSGNSGFGTSAPVSLVHIGTGDGSTYDPPSGVATPTCLYIADGTSGTPSTSTSPAASIIRRWNATAVAGSAGALYIDLTNDKASQATLETLSVRSRNNQTVDGDYIGIASRMIVEGAPGTGTSMFAMWALAQKLTRVDAGAAEYAFDNQYSRTISAATNATPIEITVTFAHYLTTGDEVYIAGVLGNTAANGTMWTITVVNSTKFTLDASVGNGAYTSGGTVYLHNARDYGVAGNRGYAAAYFLGAGNSYGNATAILVVGSGDPTRTQGYTGIDIRPDAISPLTHQAIRMPNADYLSSWNADESATYHLIGLAVGNTVSLDPNGRTIYAGTGPTQITNANGTLRVAALDSAIGTPAGSGSEIQYRASGTTFGAVTNSSVSGASIGLQGDLITSNGRLEATHAATGTGVSGAMLAYNTQTNASYGSPTSWYYGLGAIQIVNTTAASGKSAGIFGVLQMDAVPSTSHTGAAIVAQVAFGTSSTFGSNRPFHGLYVDDIAGTPTSVNTYYGIRVIEPTATVTNKFGLVVEGAQLSGFGTNNPVATVHIEGGNFVQNAATNIQAQQSIYTWGTSGPLFVFHRSLGTQASATAVTSGTPLGQMRFNGNYDTTSITLGDEATTASVNQIGAIIMVEASANWNATDNPADIRFRTGTTVGVSRANAMIITSDRRVVVGDAVVHADASYTFNVKGDAQHFSDSLTQLIIQSAGDQQSTMSLVSSAGIFASPTASASSAFGGNLKFKIYNSSNALKEVATISGGLAGANGTNPDGTLNFYLRSGVAMQTFMTLTPSLLTVSPAATFQSTVSATGEVYTTANFRAVRTTSSTTPSGGILIQQTNTNTSYADTNAWHYAVGLEQIVNNTAASGKVAGVYSLLEYSQVPATAHTGAAIVAGVYFTTALTIGSNKPLHGIYIDDILGSYTSINTYYGVRVIEPTGTVTNKYGVVVEGSQLSGFGTTPSTTLHVSGSFRIDLGSDATADMWYRASTGSAARISTSGKSAGNVLTLYDSGGGVLLPRWDTASGGGANTALSNLASVSINLSLIPQTTLDLGATTTAWRNLYIYGAGTYGSTSLKFHGTPTANRVITFPDATATVTTGTGTTNTVSYWIDANTVGAVTSSAVSGANVTFGGNLTVNTGLLNVTGASAQLSVTQNDISTLAGVVLSVGLPTGATAGGNGVSITINDNATTSRAGNLVGLNITYSKNAVQTGTPAQMILINPSAVQESLTDLASIYLRNPGVLTGKTLTNWWGLYFKNVALGGTTTNKWIVYSEASAGNAFIGDKLTIGATTAGGQCHVTAASTSTIAAIVETASSSTADCLQLKPGGTTQVKFTTTSGGAMNSVFGAAALATNAADGFVYIPTCAGTPTGTPTSYTGTAALVYDSTNNKLYVYDGGWIGVTLA